MALLLQILTATLGVRAVREALVAECGPRTRVTWEVCHAVAPGLIYCTYHTRTVPVPHPKACQWGWRAYYVWTTSGWRPFGRVMTEVS